MLKYCKVAAAQAVSDGSGVKEFASSVLTVVLAMITDQEDLDVDVLDVPLPPADPEDHDSKGNDERFLMWKSKAEAFVEDKLWEASFEVNLASAP